MDKHFTVVDPYNFRIESEKGMRKRQDRENLQASQSSLKEVRDYAWNMMAGSKRMEKVEALGMSTPGLFAGPRAKTADLVARKKAKSILAEKDAPENFLNEVARSETGWFKGMDKKLRYEIDDSSAKLRTKQFSDESPISRGKEVPLGLILDHPNLYKAYPKAKRMKVGLDPFMDSGTQGTYNPSSGKITLNMDSTMAGDDAFDTILHEIQHAIQHKEKFARGANPESAYLRIPEKSWKVLMQEQLDAVNYTNTKKTYNEILNEMEPGPIRDQAKIEWDGYLNNLNNHAFEKARFDAYKRNPGEIEARNVSARRKLNPLERTYQKPDLDPNNLSEDLIYLREKYDKPAFNARRLLKD
jgi:hypothetical protein